MHSGVVSHMCDLACRQFKVRYSDRDTPAVTRRRQAQPDVQLGAAACVKPAPPALLPLPVVA